jgi:hypothetical protein
MNKKRSRCSDEKFLEAVFSSKTYEEISLKTGQKLSTTVSRYHRIKKILLKNNIELPSMARKRFIPAKTKEEHLVSIITKLKNSYLTK